MRDEIPFISGEFCCLKWLKLWFSCEKYFYIKHAYYVRAYFENFIHCRRNFFGLIITERWLLNISKNTLILSSLRNRKNYILKLSLSQPAVESWIYCASCFLSKRSIGNEKVSSSSSIQQIGRMLAKAWILIEDETNRKCKSNPQKPMIKALTWSVSSRIKIFESE